MGQSNCTKPSATPGEPPRKSDAEMTIMRLDSAMLLPEAALPTIAPGVAGLEERYIFTGLHATGGLGRVWLARDRQLDREVAIKELFPDKAGNGKIAARFVR